MVTALKTKDQINLEIRIKGFKRRFFSVSTEARYNSCEFTYVKTLSKVESEEATEGEGTENIKGVNKN